MSDDMTGPTYTLGQAAQHSGTSRSTIQRRLRDGKVPGAVRLESGEWAIPIAGLIEAGLMSRTTPAPPEDPPEVQRLRRELELWRTLAEERLDRVNEMRSRVRELEERVASSRTAPEHLEVKSVSPTPQRAAETLVALEEEPLRRRGGRIGAFLGFD
jgi:hypothetical protein